MKSTVYSEISRTEKQIDEDTLRAELMEKVYLYEKNFLNSCEIIARDIKESKTEESMTLSVNYKLKGDISEQREIMVK